MAYRGSVKSNEAGDKRAWFVAACLVVLFLAALFLRAYWNLDAANPSEGEYVLSGGSDPYYHKRAVDAIQDNGFKHLIDDPLLNYPAGSGNPNPPLFQWSIAVAGLLLDPLLPGDLAASTWQATLWTPAIFGALTLFPIYFIGAALFDRRAGLVAALLWTVSTSAIDAGGLGLADHDSTVIFFTTLSFLFYIQTIRHFRGDGNWVGRWGAGGGIGSGMGRLFRERRTGFGYALLTAISLAAVALTWKGFNYVLGIMLLYAGIQLVVDHFRNRDTTGLYLATLLTGLVGVMIALPYYAQANVANFLTPTWYLLGFFALAGGILVVTRDLPTIIVLPVLAGIALLGIVAAFFVVPTVARSLLYATVYFKQTRVYETIAEAQGADLPQIAFSIGPVAYLLALFGALYLLFTRTAQRSRAWVATGIAAAVFAGVMILAGVTGAIMAVFGQSDAFFTYALPLFTGLAAAVAVLWFVSLLTLNESRPIVFALVWLAVALVMASSAVRFLINAVPVLAVFAAFMIVWILDWLDFAAIRKSLAANRGNTWQGLRKGTRPLHIVAAILIALLFVFPTTMLAADAALPPEAEDKYRSGSDSPFVQSFFSERMGAYGGGFGSVKPWIPALEWLDEYDANITDPAQRPAFLSWWDYGHWAISIGNHPAVADNFQNGYEFAANFILSQDEAHAIQLMAARTAEAPGADLQAALTAVGSGDPAGDAAKVARWEPVNLTLAQSAALLAKVEEQTGKKIRYVAFDIRMLPYDNPQTPSIDQNSIFYAPVTLKGQETDEYVTTRVNVGGSYVTVDEYRELARDPIRRVAAQGERLEYQETFFDSMYYRGFVGTPTEPPQTGPALGDTLETAVNNPRPGYGLQHFRAVYMGDVTRIYRGGDPSAPASYVYYPDIVILEYTPGAVVSGTVTEGGQPLSGVTVAAFDDAGRLLAESFGAASIDPADYNVPHSQTMTGADGTFSLRAPFALEGGNVTIVAQREGIEVGRAAVDITREDAAASRVFENVQIVVQRGSVEGFAFNDVNGDGAFNESNESLLTGFNVTIGGVTAAIGPDGKYRLEGVSAGSQNVTSDAAEYQVATRSARVRVLPGETVTHNVTFEPREAEVNATLVVDRNADGTIDAANETVSFATVQFTRDENATGNMARNETASTGVDGTFSVDLVPGTYIVTARYTEPTTNATYSLREPLVLTAGQVVTDKQLVLVRDETA